MKIEGRMEFGGITFHVAIEAPDDTTEIWLTNVGPNHSVAVLERLPVHCLNFSPEDQTMLATQGVHTAGDLLDTAGKSRLATLPDGLRARVEELLKTLRAAAISFTPLPAPPEDSAARSPPPAGESPKPEHASAAAAVRPELEAILTADIGECDALRSEQQDRLRAKGVHTIRGLVILGEDGLIMTPTFTTQRVAHVRAWLAERGVFLNGSEVAGAQSGQPTAPL